MEMEVLPADKYVEFLLNEGHREPCEIDPDEKFELPAWYDEKKYKRGQKFIRDNLFSQFTCTLSGLVCVLAIPTITNILAKTHKSATTTTAYRRYISTIFHVTSWYYDELRPGTRAWNSLMAVRTRHFRASKVSQMKKQNGISQLDMVLTQFGFFAFGLLSPDKIGMSAEQDGVEGYIHFWRTIGYMLGIQDRFNIGRDSSEECKQVCDIIRREVYCHNLLSPPEYFVHMVSMILRSMWFYNPFLTEASYLYYTFWLIGVDGYKYSKDMKTFSIKYTFSESENRSVNNNYIKENKQNMCMVEKKLSAWNTTSLRFLIGVHCRFIKTTFGKWYLNASTLLTLFLLNYFPFLSIYYFGLRNAYVNMFEEDISEKTEVLRNKEAFQILQY